MADRISAPKPAQPLPSRLWSCSELTAGLKHVLDDAATGDLQDIQARYSHNPPMSLCCLHSPGALLLACREALEEQLNMLDTDPESVPWQQSCRTQS